MTDFGAHALGLSLITFSPYERTPMNPTCSLRNLLALACIGLTAQAHAGLSPQQSGLSVSGASVVSFNGYDGAPSTHTGVLSQGLSGTLVADTAGTIAFTYLGKEAALTNRFTFNGQSIGDFFGLNIGQTLSAQVDAGAVAFGFTASTPFGLFAPTRTFSNGDIGSMMFASSVPTSRFGTFDYVIGFNEKGPNPPLGDGDFDDFVIGVRFTPSVTPAIPEPGTWALMGLGLAGLVWRTRRHRQAG